MSATITVGRFGEVIWLQVQGKEATIRMDFTPAEFAAVIEYMIGRAKAQDARPHPNPLPKS